MTACRSRNRQGETAMRVKVNFMGPLGLAIGQGAVDFELEDGAVYGTLLREIDRRFGPKFPKGMWDETRHCFKQGVLTIGQGRDLDDPETPLLEGEKIRFVPMLIGG